MSDDDAKIHSLKKVSPRLWTLKSGVKHWLWISAELGFQLWQFVFGTLGDCDLTQIAR